MTGAKSIVPFGKREEVKQPLHCSNKMVTKSKKEPKEVTTSSDNSVFKVFDMGRWKVGMGLYIFTRGIYGYLNLTNICICHGQSL